MSDSIKAVVFDWAWTLVDLGEENDRLPFAEVFEFLREKSVVPPDFEEFYALYREIFYSSIGDSQKDHREACFEPVLKYLLFYFSIDIAGRTTVKEILTRYYKKVYSSRNVFPDTVPALQALQASGRRMGIISNTTNPPFMKDYERVQSGLDPYFEFSLYSSDFPYRKPHASIFRLASRYLKLDEKNILYVGDNPKNDIAGAQKAGMRAVWINRLGETCPEGIVPEFEIRSLSELSGIDCLQG